jgi:hypothetical protein
MEPSLPAFRFVPAHAWEKAGARVCLQCPAHLYRGQPGALLAFEQARRQLQTFTPHCLVSPNKLPN